MSVIENKCCSNNISDAVDTKIRITTFTELFKNFNITNPLYIILTNFTVTIRHP